MPTQIRLKRWVWALLWAVLSVLFMVFMVLAQSGHDGKQNVFLPLVTQNFNTDQSQAEITLIDGTWVNLIADPTYSPARIPAPDLSVLTTKNSQAVAITVNYNPASCPAGTTAWPATAQTAFTYAANIWRTLLTGNQTVVIDACWRNNLKPDVLGSARATQRVVISGKSYSIALANQILNSDQNGATAEIQANFNSNFTWYLGTDGNTPTNQYDFVSVVLHEIGHGLGFVASMQVDNGTTGTDDPIECNGTSGIGCWGQGSPVRSYIFDDYIENGSGQNLITVFANSTITLGQQLTGNNIFFDGTNANAANNGNRPKLYAPASWAGGSSISHLDDIYDGTLHALMTHSISNGESAHHPGAITLGILRDLGWNRPNLQTVYVDINAGSTEDGSSTNPFNTVTEGIIAVDNGGVVQIRPGTYREAMTIRRPMTIRSTGGNVIIQP